MAEDTAGRLLGIAPFGSSHCSSKELHEDNSRNTKVTYQILKSQFFLLNNYLKIWLLCKQIVYLYCKQKNNSVNEINRTKTQCLFRT